jgi:hypothetical protein
LMSSWMQSRQDMVTKFLFRLVVNPKWFRLVFFGYLNYMIAFYVFQCI